MTRLCVAVFYMIVLGPLLPGQQVSDANDAIYHDLETWQAQGLLGELPPLRPYPVQVLSQLLERVKAGGDAGDQDRAAAYMDEMSAPLTAHARVSGQLRSDLASVYEQYSVQAELLGILRPGIAFSVMLAVIPSNGPVNSLLPVYERPVTDIVYDASVAPLGSSSLTPRIGMTGAASFGTESLYLQAGILRAGFGPIWSDSIVLSPTAPQAGQVSVILRQDYFTLTMALFDIAATNGDGSGGPKPNKYLSLHSVEIYPWDWLTFGIFESVVWGNRFELLYVLPLPTVLFYAQGLNGYGDNSFIGVSAGLKLPASVRANFVLYVDDAAFNDLIKLNFNTMFVLAAQSEVAWTPHLPWLEKLNLGYSIVTPYMYSHIDAGASAPNYQNYTNNGQNMATSLPPNSDRIELHALARPLPMIDLDVFARFIRHGNGSEGIPGGGDGTVFDDGYVAGVPTFTPSGGYVPPAGMLYTRFLTQSTIERTFQAGFRIGAQIRTSFGAFEGSIGYTFEYCWNYRLGAINRMANYGIAELKCRY
jgi:hypothetical protein